MPPFPVTNRHRPCRCDCSRSIRRCRFVRRSCGRSCGFRRRLCVLQFSALWYVRPCRPVFRERGRSGRAGCLLASISRCRPFRRGSSATCAANCRNLRLVHEPGAEPDRGDGYLYPNSPHLGACDGHQLCNPRIFRRAWRNKRRTFLQLLLNGANIALSTFLGVYLDEGLAGVAWGTTCAEVATKSAGLLIVGQCREYCSNIPLMTRS